MMENLHEAILQMFDDYIQPSAAGAAYPTPWLWPEEAHADAAVYEEQKRLRARCGNQQYDVPKWLYRKKAKKPEDRGFEVDRRALMKIMSEYDERMLVRMKTKPYHIEDGNIVERALVSIADDDSWRTTEPAEWYQPKVYRIR